MPLSHNLFRIAIVIGTGEAGSTVAKQCRAAGWEVAIADSRPFGGTCALRGCTPKKVLVNAAELIDWLQRLEGKGLSSQGTHIDWSALMRFKRTFTEPVPSKREEQYADAGITMFHGQARFVDQTSIQVGADTLTGRYILIATGAKPTELGIPGEELLTTSDQFLELEQLPKRIIFVGGGYISFEFAHVAVRAGAQVQILHEGDRPLEHFDPDLVAQLIQATRDIGAECFGANTLSRKFLIDIRLSTAVKAIEKAANNLIVHAAAGDTQTFEADLVVHGASRMPEIDELDLSKAGVKREKKGVLVNEYLQSVSNPAVYAAGDAAAGAKPQLTPVASMEAHVVASNLLEGNHHKPDYTEVPSVVFTVPRLAFVGLTEEMAQKQGLKFKTNYKDNSDWLFSREISTNYSGFKVLIEEDSNRILKAHLLGPHAEAECFGANTLSRKFLEVINVFATAIKAGFSTDDIKKTIYAYPTGASDISNMV